MHVSTDSGSSPVSDIRRTASNRYGNSNRLTTKPGMSGTSTGVLPIATHSWWVRARVSGLASSGNTTSTSAIRGTGLKTCSPAKRSGWPLACASSAIDSDEVVVASTAPVPRVARELAEIGQDRGFAAMVLDDRLHQEARGVELVEVGRDLDPAGVGAAVELVAALCDARSRPVGGFAGARPQHDVGASGRDGRQPARDRSRTCDSECLSHDPTSQPHVVPAGRAASATTTIKTATLATTLSDVINHGDQPRRQHYRTVC